MSYIPGLALSNKGDIPSSNGTTAIVVPVGALAKQVPTVNPLATAGWDWESLSTIVGSIFSMVGPAGAANAAVVYDFTRYDPAYTLANNLIYSNQSGTAAFNLAAVSSPTYTFSSLTGGGALTPSFSANVQGGCLSVTGANGAITSLGTDNTLRITGAITIEVLTNIASLSTTTGDAITLLNMSAAGETEDTNILYQLSVEVTAGPVYNVSYFAEHGVGVNITASNFAVIASPVGSLTHFALTRKSTGEIVGYINGRPCSSLITPTDAGGGGVIVPTRGANPTQNLTLNPTSNGTKTLSYYAIKITGAEFTPAQIQASYHLTMNGLG